jgi:hypothetical protein
MRKVTINSEYKQLIPEKLIPKLEEIEQNPPKISGFRISYIYEICYWIITKKTDDCYSYLNMKYLKKNIPQGDKYLKYLRSKSIIERSPNYIPGERSYGYRFTNDYNGKIKRCVLLIINLFVV